MRLGIYGYGNLGRFAEANAKLFEDVELVGVFTRRNVKDVKTLGTPVYPAEDVLSFKDKIDVLFIAGGSANDLPVMTPQLAKDFNVIDSFDNHSMMVEHVSAVNESAKQSGHLALVAAGWDPGVFSLERMIFDSFLPNGKSYTFWGRGVSQGHSNAIRRIEGVKDARQYTNPRPEALETVRSGKMEDMNAQSMHTRECYVVAEDGADKTEIERKIKTMPGYFEGYETTVNFISQEELDKNHSGLPHGGFVMRNGQGNSFTHRLEFALNLGSNPEFTSSVILAYSRALFRLYKEGVRGCITVADVAPKYLCREEGMDLIHKYI
ncbi:MAG: diaminopimelate dehydrogenase [Sphaerochaetaceae bacterium]|nr:diaminopimelate dehydrogenase [Sphaerochaetaceae bacterium]